MFRQMGSRRGVVLLFSIAVLALLSLLAVVFATTSKMERNVSRNYVDDARAKMCAQAGLELALTALREIASRQGWDDPNSPWLFPLDTARNPFDPNWGFAIELARTPSLMGGPALPTGAPVSGTQNQQLASTYDPGRDYYRLKVLDCGAQINVNMFDISPGSPAKRVLEGILNTLGQAIQDTYGGINPIANQARAITDYRLTLPGQRYANEAQLLEALRVQFPSDFQRRYSILRDFVTTEGWIDPSLCIAGNYNQGRFPISPSNRLGVTQSLRSPINVNTAPEPVLVAVLTGLCGYELTMRPDAGAIMGVAMMQWDKSLQSGSGGNSYISYNTARQIARALITRRNGPQGAFKTWAEFEQFVDTLALTQNQRSVVKVNANPNLRFNKFNPNDVVFHRVDKIDLGYFPGGASGTPLKGGTTEFSFSSMGYFEIEALGRVSRFRNNTEEMQASKVLFTVVQAYEAIRLTTQKDFIDNVVSVTRARSYPESLDERTYGGENGDERPTSANPNDGQIAIGTEWDMGARAGQTWYHAFQNTFNATSPNQGPIAGELQKHESGGAFSGGDLSVQDGNDLVPDGVMTWRLPGGMGEELNFPMTSGIIGDQAAALRGSVDLWVKLSSDPTLGSNEVLFYAVKELYANQPRTGQRWGLAWKLERFGTRIRSTRFLYGFPDRETVTPLFRAPGVLAPGMGVNFAYTEVDFFATQWRAHEWHRLTHTWTNGTEQTLVVDGTTAMGMTFTLPRDQMRGRQQIINGFRLITLDADQRFQICGYNFNPALSMNVYNQQWAVARNNPLNRYANATIDEVRFANNNGSTGARDRYGIQNGATWRGRIPANRFGRGRLGSVSYTVYYPRIYRTTNLTPGQLRIGFNAGFPSKGLQPAPAPASAAVTDGEGWGVYPPGNKAIPQGEDFQFEIRFRNPGGLTPLNVTPVFDDVTVTWMGTPRMLEYSWVTRPDPQ